MKTSELNALPSLSSLSRLVIAALLLVACSPSTVPTANAHEPPEPDNAKVFDFESGAIGETPPDFTTGLTGNGGPVRWDIVSAKDAPSGSTVLGQLSHDKTDKRYPHIVYDNISAQDVDVSVKFKTLSGRVDASGGIVFRYQDSGNCYVVRANSLEGNVVAYKAENGRRKSIGIKGNTKTYGVDVTVPHLQWNTLRVIARGDLFSIYLNGKKVFDVENTVFSKAGKIGLWTKADAVTHFDDLTIAVLDK